MSGFIYWVLYFYTNIKSKCEHGNDSSATCRRRYTAGKATHSLWRMDGSRKDVAALDIDRDEWIEPDNAPI